jgi:hypothetical protein
MFKRQTLFVLGAGSSFEVDIPLGTGLAKTISATMDIRFGKGMEPIGSGDIDLFSYVTYKRHQERTEFQEAAWLIRDGIGLSQSIDDFLDMHRSNPYVVECGKAAIVKSVLEAEGKSRLYFGGSSETETFIPYNIADTWFVKFMRMLGRDIPKENVNSIFDPVSIIVFNYNRCVEHFLVHALQKLYGIRGDEASAIVDDLHIIHPYGVVGDLRAVPFGTTRANYVELARSIRTYTEQIAAGERIAQLAAEVERAQCIVFLGFAYHSQNMLILKPPKAMPQNIPVYGTAYNMSDADVEVVTHQIADFFTDTMSTTPRSQRKIRLENKLKCADLFDNYARSLSGGD